MEIVTIEVPKRSIFARAKRLRAHHLSDAGLVISAVAIAPLIAFAVLWASLLVMLGVMWLLSTIGFL